MEEKTVLTTPLNESELSNVSAGGAGEVTQIHIGPGGSGTLYSCYNCGGIDFYIIANTPTTVTVRCMRCNTVSCVPQT